MPLNIWLKAESLESADTLLDTLTVREMLWYTAELKCSHREPKAAKLARVDDLIEKLNLTVRLQGLQYSQGRDTYSSAALKP